MHKKSKTRWHKLDIDQALGHLESTADKGLSSDEADGRLKQYGLNTLIEEAGRTPWLILWEQITSTMALILIGAAVIAGVAGSLRDSAAIFAIVILFALLGFVQDYRAERAIAALKKLAVPMVRVRRSGELLEVPSLQLVPGDIVLLEAGNVVPADCRLLDAYGLRVQESLLTGESEAVDKHTDLITATELPLGDRRNLLFMGTLVSAGRAVALVVSTGMETELGAIATMLQQVGQEWTPLQKRLDRLGKVLAVASVLIALLVFAAGMLQGEALRDMLLLAVSVAVAAIPEGLPAVVTITLALGAQRMLRRHALIRRLPAVETLGSVTVICSDKTGTLTQNKMVLTELLTVQEILRGADIKGQQEAEQLVLMIGALCNDAELKLENDEYVVLGDPTEGAFLVAATAQGIIRADLKQALPRVDEIPFDSVKKRMITAHQIFLDMPCPLPPNFRHPSGRLLASKGALDAVLELSDQVLIEDVLTPMLQEHRTALLAAADRFSSEGQRVLALAIRGLRADQDEGIESLAQGFCCIGLVALTDPPRQEAKAAVQLCLDAGIRPVMISGDHPLTALAIARQVGIDGAAGALTGVELDRLTPEQFDAAVSQVSVYARVAPEHKLRIVESIQRQGGVAAMTGDGVNDAPALKRADVGVAMGKVGTDVAREAADMVLLDDNFATIVAAVEEGRTIYDNIRKFVVFSVAGNTGKILAVLVLPFVGLSMPLTPLQLLWLNLLTDGLLGFGMGVERPEPDVMLRSPIASDSQIFDARTIRYVLFTGGLIGSSCMAITWLVWQGGGPWQTVLFASLAVAQVAQAMALRSFRSSFLQLGLFTNPTLLLMIACVLLLQGLAIWLPQLQAYFLTAPLSINQLGLVFLPAVLVFVALEGQKWVSRFWGKQV